MRWSAVIALVAVLLCGALAYATVDSQVDRLFLDAFMHLAADGGDGEPVLVVAVDDRSIAAVGRWPWSRATQAALVDRLAGAAAVAYDVALPEASADRAADRALAEAFARQGRVVLPILAARIGAVVQEVPPLAMFAQSAAGIGHVALPQNSDGIARGVSLWAGATEPLMPALALATLAVADGRQAADPPRALGQRNGLYHADDRVVPFLAMAPPTVVAAIDVLTERVSPALWRDRMVVVGVFAAGIADLHSVRGVTGVRQMPGALLQAQAIQAVAAGATAEIAPPAVAAPAAMVAATLSALLFACNARTRAVLATGLVLPPAASLALLMVGALWVAPTQAMGMGVLLAVLREVGLRCQQRRLLARQGEQITMMLQMVQTGVLLVDAAGRIRLANAAAGRIAGSDPEALIGVALEDVITDGGDATDLLAAAPAAVQTALSQAEVKARLVRVAAASAAPRTALLTRAAMPPAAGQPPADLVALTDVSTLVAATRELERLATHDLTTGLPNRHFVNRHLPYAMARAQRKGGDVAVLAIDLDHFKDVNDRYGHQVGDALLSAVANRLRTVCRASDVVARLGGDEFLVILEDIAERHHAALLADKMLETFAKPIVVGDHQVDVELSIGASCATDQPGDAEALLGRADRAMYAAKHRRGAFRLFSPELEAAARYELELRDELRRSLDERRFELHYQPRVQIGDGNITGFEALLRWRRPNGTPVPPSVFVPIAENAGLIEPITEWIIDEALGVLCRWRAQSGRALAVSVNVSARHFLEPELPRTIETSLRAAGVPPSVLTVELTESMLMRDPEKASAVMGALRECGVKLAIDDFGTGYSSLAYLRDFPIDELKIDRSFTARIGTGDRDDLIVTAIAQLAHSLRLEPVAEGVEHAHQVAFLRRCRVHQAQGFLFSRPVPATTVADLLTADRPLGAPPVFGAPGL